MSAKPERSSRSAFEKAQRLHRQGKLDQARAGYLKILRKQPNHPDALHYLGVLTFRQGNEARALELIQRAIAANPGDGHAHKNLGNIHLESDRFEEAEACYRKAATLNEGDGTNYSNLCIALRSQGRYQEAITAGLKGVQLMPKHAVGWFNLGNAYQRSGHQKEAERCFERCFSIDPSFAAAYDSYCQTVFAREQRSIFGRKTLRKTIAAYRRWQEADPGNNVAGFMLAALEGRIDLRRAPASFVRELFDHAARTYNQRLAAIENRVPELVEAALLRSVEPPQRNLAVLDAGCGTGLCAAILRPYAARLTGVDLSGGMLARARGLGLYDRLVESELVGFLKESSTPFDLVLFADTLCYFGELGEVLTATAGALAAGGKTVFTVEKAPAKRGSRGYRLNPHGRYAHTASFVHDCMQQAGLRLLFQVEDRIRLEKGIPVAGLIVAAEKS